MDIEIYERNGPPYSGSRTQVDSEQWLTFQTGWFSSFDVCDPPHPGFIVNGVDGYAPVTKDPGYEGREYYVQIFGWLEGDSEYRYLTGCFTFYEPTPTPTPTPTGLPFNGIVIKQDGQIWGMVYHAEHE